MARGRVEGIFVGPEAAAPLDSVPEVGAEEGRGLVGDRYWSGQGTLGKPRNDREVTLIEAESLEALAVGAAILTSGTIRVGDAIEAAAELELSAAREPVPAAQTAG
jgi:hypothetical protein